LLSFGSFGLVGVFEGVLESRDGEGEIDAFWELLMRAFDPATNI
jgi:hypothetical protein